MGNSTSSKQKSQFKDSQFTQKYRNDIQYLQNLDSKNNQQKTQQTLTKQSRRLKKNQLINIEEDIEEAEDDQLDELDTKDQIYQKNITEYHNFQQPSLNQPPILRKVKSRDPTTTTPQKNQRKSKLQKQKVNLENSKNIDYLIKQIPVSKNLNQVKQKITEKNRESFSSRNNSNRSSFSLQNQNYAKSSEKKIDSVNYQFQKQAPDEINQAKPDLNIHQQDEIMKNISTSMSIMPKRAVKKNIQEKSKSKQNITQNQQQESLNFQSKYKARSKALLYDDLATQQVNQFQKKKEQQWLNDSISDDNEKSQKQMRSGVMKNMKKGITQPKSKPNIIDKIISKFTNQKEKPQINTSDQSFSDDNQYNNDYYSKQNQNSTQSMQSNQIKSIKQSKNSKDNSQKKEKDKFSYLYDSSQKQKRSTYLQDEKSDTYQVLSSNKQQTKKPYQSNQKLSSQQNSQTLNNKKINENIQKKNQLNIKKPSIPKQNINQQQQQQQIQSEKIEQNLQNSKDQLKKRKKSSFQNKSSSLELSQNTNNIISLKNNSQNYVSWYDNQKYNKTQNQILSQVEYEFYDENSDNKKNPNQISNIVYDQDKLYEDNLQKQLEEENLQDDDVYIENVSDFSYHRNEINLKSDIKQKDELKIPQNQQEIKNDKSKNVNYVKSYQNYDSNDQSSSLYQSIDIKDQKEFKIEKYLENNDVLSSIEAQVDQVLGIQSVELEQLQKSGISIDQIQNRSQSSYQSDNDNDSIGSNQIFNNSEMHVQEAGYSQSSYEDSKSITSIQKLPLDKKKSSIKKQIQEDVISLKRQQSLILSIQRYDDNILQEDKYEEQYEEDSPKNYNQNNLQKKYVQEENIIQEEIQEDEENDKNFSQVFEYVSSTKTFKRSTNFSTFFKIKTGVEQLSALTQQNASAIIGIFAENLQNKYLNLNNLEKLLKVLQIETRQQIIDMLESEDIQQIFIKDLITIMKIKNNQEILSSKKQLSSKLVSEMLDQTTCYFKDKIKLMQRNSSLDENPIQSLETDYEEIKELDEEQQELFRNWLLQLDENDEKNQNSLLLQQQEYNSTKLKTLLKQYVQEVFEDVIQAYNTFLKQKREQNLSESMVSQLKTIDFTSSKKRQLKRQLRQQNTKNDKNDATKNKEDNKNSNIVIQNVEQQINDNSNNEYLPSSLNFFNNNKIVLLEDIKKGGQGEIKSGYSMESKQLLVIKTFKYEWDFRTEEKLYRLVQEKNLNHLFLKVISKDESNPYKIIMERGACDLQQFFILRQKQQKQIISYQEFMYIFNFLAEALQQLIQIGIYFSDMKPDNILLQYDENVHTELKLFLTDLGGSYNYNDYEDDFQYPNCITKFYFPLDFINNEIVQQKRNIQKHEMMQCEMFTLARTMQSCIVPDFRKEIIQKKNINQFLREYESFLGPKLTNILNKMLNFNKIDDPYQSFDQLVQDLRELKLETPNYAPYLINSDNSIKEWQEHLVKEKQNLANLNVFELIEQAKFYGKTGLYRNQESVLKQIDNTLHKYLNSGQEKNKNSTLFQIVKNHISLGLNFQNQGKYDQAMKYYLQAQEISAQLCKKKQKQFIICYGDCLNMIGGIQQREGKYQEALENFFNSLEIFEEIYGKDNIQSSNIYLNIGNIYIDKGDAQKSLEYYKKSLEIKNQFYDSNHTELALNYIGIGVCYNDSQQYDKALENYLKCKDIYEYNEMQYTINMADVYNNLGNLYYRKKQYEEAKIYYHKSSKIQQSIYGVNHINTSSTILNIAVILKNMGEYKQALKLYYQVLEIQKEYYKLQPHYEISSTYLNLACLFVKMNDNINAHKYFKQAYDMRVIVFGEDHFQTIDAKEYLNELQELIQKQKEIEENVTANKVKRCSSSKIRINNNKKKNNQQINKDINVQRQLNEFNIIPQNVILTK